MNKHKLHAIIRLFWSNKHEHIVIYTRRIYRSNGNTYLQCDFLQANVVPLVMAPYRGTLNAPRLSAPAFYIVSPLRLATGKYSLVRYIKLPIVLAAALYYV